MIGESDGGTDSSGEGRTSPLPVYSGRSTIPLSVLHVPVSRTPVSLSANSVNHHDDSLRGDRISSEDILPDAVAESIGSIITHDPLGSSSEARTTKSE